MVQKVAPKRAKMGKMVQKLANLPAKFFLGYEEILIFFVIMTPISRISSYFLSFFAVNCLIHNSMIRFFGCWGTSCSTLRR